jgi:hypothetical protein
MRIEKTVQKPTLRLYIERHTIVMIRDSERDLRRAVTEIRDKLNEYLEEEEEPKKIWWKFMRR